MKAILLTHEKYDLRESEDIEEAHFRPVCIPHRDFYSAVFKNHRDSEDVIYINHGSNPDNPDQTSTYHHVSGATIRVDQDDVLIIGTKKAINDARYSLELLTEKRLEEVRRELLIEA